jgi:hypothetical protein
MGIRDKEIERIVQYANGLGVKILWKKHQTGVSPGAEWAVDGSEITIYCWNKQSKTQIILDLIHELAHHMAWINRGRKDEDKVTEAIQADDAATEENRTISRQKRKLIYDSEKSDSKFQIRIFKELGIRLPIWRLKANTAVDMWVYRRFWIDGKIPPEKQIATKAKEIKRLERRRYESKNRH